MGASQIARLIVARLGDEEQTLKEEFAANANIGSNVRYFILDGCLPEDSATAVAAAEA